MLNKPGAKPKSHHGCDACRRRKVKCDEARPSCAHCSRRGSDCTYTDLPVRQSFWTATHSGPRARRLTTSPSENWTVPSSRDPGSISICSAAPSPSFSHSSCRREDSRNPLSERLAAAVDSPPLITPTSLQDLKLLHHFTCSTAAALNKTNTSHSNLWRETIPQLSFSHPFLLHGILAMSALHLAHLNSHSPSKSNYEQIGTAHYTTALGLFHEALATVNESTCHVIFAFSMIAPSIALLLFSLTHTEPNKSKDVVSQPRHDTWHGDGIGDMLSIIPLLKGVSVITVSYAESLQRGTFAPFLKRDINTAADQLNDEDEHMFSKLGVLASQCNDVDHQEPGRVVDYGKLVKELRQTFLLRATNPKDRGVWVTWMMKQEQSFLDALRKEEDMAVAILGVSGVLLDSMRDEIWTTNTGRKVVALVAPILRRNECAERWEPILKWAETKVGAYDKVTG